MACWTVSLNYSWVSNKDELISGFQITDTHLSDEYYQRALAVKGLRRLNVKIPFDRQVKYQTKVLGPYKRNEALIEEYRDRMMKDSYKKYKKTLDKLAK